MGSETAFGGLAMWQTRGIGTNITKPIIARFSKKKINWWEIFSEKTIGLYTNPKAGKHLAVSLSDQAIDGYEYPMVSRVPTAALGELNEGDILQIMQTEEYCVCIIFNRSKMFYLLQKNVIQGVSCVRSRKNLLIMIRRF